MSRSETKTTHATQPSTSCRMTRRNAIAANGTLLTARIVLALIDALSRFTAMESRRFGIEEQWWVAAVRGGAAILFGVLALLAPAASLMALVLCFGAYALFDGAFTLVTAFRQKETRAGVRALEGTVSLAAGVLALVWPGIGALALLLAIAARWIVTGLAALVAAVRLRKSIQGEWLLGASGLLSVAFGLLLTIFPGAGALAMILWIGAHAIVFGGLLLALAYRLRRRVSRSTAWSERRARRAAPAS